MIEPIKSESAESEISGTPMFGAEMNTDSSHQCTRISEGDEAKFRWRLRTVYRNVLTPSGLNDLLQLPCIRDGQQRVLERFFDESVKLFWGKHKVSGMRWQSFDLGTGVQTIEAEFDTRFGGLQHNDLDAVLVVELDRLRRETCFALNQLALGFFHAGKTAGLKWLKWPAAGSLANVTSNRSSSLLSVLKRELASGTLGRLTLSVDESNFNSLSEIAEVVQQISVRACYSPENSPQLELICNDEALRQILLGGGVTRSDVDDHARTSVHGLHPVRIALDVRGNVLGMTKAHLWLSQDAMAQIHRWFQFIEDMGLSSISAPCPWVVWDISTTDNRPLVTNVWNEISVIGSCIVSVTGHFELQRTSDECLLPNPIPMYCIVEASAELVPE